LIQQNWTFSPSADRIIGYYIKPGFTTSIDCKSILSSSTLQLIGVGSVCFWNSSASNRFEIVFGANPQVTLQSSLSILTPLNSEVKLVLAASKTPILPTAIIQGALKIGTCDALQLSGELSSDQSRRSLVYKWDLKNTEPKFALLQKFVQNVSSPVLNIQKDLLITGTTMKFTLTVSNFLGLFSSEVSHDVVKTFSSTVPVAKISGPEKHLIDPTNYYQLEGVVPTSECSSSSVFTYTWLQTLGPKVNPTRKGRLLIFPSNTFPSTIVDYEFKLTISSSDSSEIAETTAKLGTVLKPIVSQIFGGSRKVSRNETVRLDGSSSYDPMNETTIPKYEWSCINMATSGLCSGIFLNSSSVIQIPRLSIASGSYLFTLTYMVGSRVSTASVELTFVEEPLPQVIISPIPTKVNVDGYLVLLARVDGPPGKTYLTEWVAESNRFSLTSSQTLSSTNNTEIVIKPYSMEPLDTITFRINVIELIEKRSFLTTTQTFASITTTTNAPPSPAIVDVTPISGETLKTDFSISCLQWVDPDQPLQYSFGYLDPSTGVEKILTPYSLSPKAIVQLPAGKEPDFKVSIVANVIDSLGALTKSFRNVTVSPVFYANETAKLDELNSKVNNFESQIASGSYADVGRVADLVLQTLNVPKTTQNNVTQLCPNGCVNGKCVSFDVCQCEAKYTGLDCSYTFEELEARKAIRGKIFDALQSSFSSLQGDNPIIDQEVVSQQTAVIAQLTSNSDELSVSNLNSSISFVNKLVTAPQKAKFETGRVPSSIIDSSINALSNTAKVAFRDKSISKNVEQTTQNLLQVVIDRKIAGEEATLSIQKNIAISGEKEQVDSLGGKTIKLQQFYQGKPLSVPSSFSIPSEIKEIQTSGDVNLQAINYGVNPFGYSNSSGNITSSVVSLTLFKPGSGSIRVYGLSKPINITIPGVYNETSQYLDCGIPGTSSACKYWNEATETWEKDGCTLIEFRNDSIVCQCNHLTSFASFLEDVPKPNIPSPTAFLVRINPANGYPLFVGIAIGLIYVVLSLAFLIYGELKNYYSVKAGVIIEEVGSYEEYGVISKFIEKFLVAHAWISIFFLPKYFDKTLTRNRRLTILYFKLILAIVLNGLFKSAETDQSINTKILTPIVTSLIAIPLTSFIKFMFLQFSVRNSKKYDTVLSVTPPRAVKKNIGDRKMDDQMIEDEMNDELEEIEKKFLNTKSKDQKLDEISLIPKELTNIKNKIAEKSTKDGSRSLIQYIDVENRLDVKLMKYHMNLRETRMNQLNFKLSISQVSSSGYNALINSLGQLIAQLDNIFDSFLLYFKRRRLNLNPIFTRLFLAICWGIFSLLYFVLIAGVLISLNYAIPTYWLPFYNTGVGGGALIVFVYFNIILFTKLKVERFYITDQWEISYISIVLSVIFGIVECVALFGLLFFALVFQLFSTDFYQIVLGVLYLIALIGATILWLYLSNKKPKERDYHSLKKKKVSLLLPWYFVIIPYVLTWVACIFLTWSIYVIANTLDETSRGSQTITWDWINSCIISIALGAVVYTPLIAFVEVSFFEILIPIIRDTALNSL
jgi:hypothetical protein